MNHDLPTAGRFMDLIDYWEKGRINSLSLTLKDLFKE